MGSVGLMKGWTGLSRMWLIALCAAVVLIIGLGLGLGTAFASSGYNYKNTDSGQYMTPGEPAGSQIVMGNLGEATTFDRIDYYNWGGEAAYEYKDVVTGDCLKVDPNLKDWPVVEEPCASGHTSTTAEEELWSDPPSVSNVYITDDDPNTLTGFNLLEQYGSVVDECSGGICAQIDWALVSAG